MRRVLIPFCLALGAGCGGPLPSDDLISGDPLQYPDGYAPGDVQPGFEEGRTGGPTVSAPFRLLLTDAPLDGVEEVNVTFDEVSIQDLDRGDWHTVTSTTQTFDLLSLQNGVTADLGFTELSTGTYGQIRLHLVDAWLVIDGEPVELEVPSGFQSGLKVLHQFTIEPDIENSLTLDFDAGESVHQTGNGEYRMRPVIKALTATTAPEQDQGQTNSGMGGRPDSSSGI